MSKSTRVSISRALLLTLVAGAAMPLAACTDDVVLGGSTPECSTYKDCANNGAADTVCVGGRCRVRDPDAAAEDRAWGCVGSGAPTAAEPFVPVTVPFRFVDAYGATPFVGIEVVACDNADVDCAQPLAASTTNASGEVDVVVFSGFRGDFKVTGEGIAPVFIAALPVPDKARTASRVTWALSKGSGLLGLVAVGGAPQDDLAHVLFITNDCQHAPVADVTVIPEIRGPQTYGFYLDANGAPSLDRQATAPSGIGGFINLSPRVNAFAVRRTNGETVGTHGVILRPGALTYVVLPPS